MLSERETSFIASRAQGFQMIDKEIFKLICSKCYLSLPLSLCYQT